jgi:hypothetical protein
MDLWEVGRMMMKKQVGNCGKTRDNPAEKRNEHFAKFLHPLWDLNLIQDHLKSRDDLLVLLAMLRYADFDTGECAVFIPTVMRDTGIKYATQVKRCMERVESLGAFWRPEGTKGFKKIYGKSARRYFRASGKEIITHAVEHDLIGEEKMREVELRQVEKDIDDEARQAQERENQSDRGGQSGKTGSLDDVPETLDELIEEMRKGKKE